MNAGRPGSEDDARPGLAGERLMTPAGLQQLENGPALRIKFASIRNDGSLASDAGSDYGPFFAALAAEITDWAEEPNTLSVQTRYEYQRDAHVLRHGATEVAAVEHETGIEVIVAGVAINIASAALLGLASWSWSKWKQVRGAQQAPGVEKVDPSLVLEGIRARNEDGGPKEIVRVERRGPLTVDKVSEHIRDFISEVVSPAPKEAPPLATSAVNLTFHFHFDR
jgi:hypothetical protein